VLLVLIFNPNILPTFSNVAVRVIAFLFGLAMFGSISGLVAFYPVFKIVDSMLRLVFPKYHAQRRPDTKAHSAIYNMCAIIICGIFMFAETKLILKWFSGDDRIVLLLGCLFPLIFCVVIFTGFETKGQKARRDAVIRDAMFDAFVAEVEADAAQTRELKQGVATKSDTIPLRKVTVTARRVKPPIGSHETESNGKGKPQ
jgi:hypothetical protein